MLLLILSLPILWILLANVRKAEGLGVLSKPAKADPWTVEKLQLALVEFDGKLQLSEMIEPL